MRLQDFTPEIYYTHSRDFQLLGRLYDIVLNSVKTDIDSIKYIRLGLNSNEALLNLLALTLGFKAKHSYNNKQLAAVCSVLPTIIRNKGNINALTLAVNAILNANGINDYSEGSFNYDTMTLTLYIPEQINDITLLEDLTDYVMPAGTSLRIVKEIKELRQVTTNVAITNSAEVYVNGVINVDANKINDISKIRATTADTVISDSESIGNTAAFQNTKVLPNTSSN